MGFDTYLEIDGAVALDWRKYASTLPRLLFRHDQYIIGTVTDEELLKPQVSVVFGTTAADTLDNMASAGLGWAATVAAYAEYYSPDGMAAGMNVGRLLGQRLDDDDVERADQEFRRLPPETDLVNLGRTMAHQWQDDCENGVVLLDDLNLDGSIGEVSAVTMAAFLAAESAGVPAPFAAARAAENISVLDRQAPLLAWPMVICVFLKHLPANSKVTFNLSEDAWQHADDDGFDPAEHAAKWWESASSGLAGYARLMGRMFAVLTSFDGDLGRDYWFARATELLAKLERPFPSVGKAKGDRLEALVEALLRTEEPELAVVEKNYRTAAEEIDVLVSNSLRDPFWVAHGSPLILVECKAPYGEGGNRRPQDLRIEDARPRRSMQDRNLCLDIRIHETLS